LGVGNMKCPESIEELQEWERLVPLCKIELYNQAKARIEKGEAKSVSEASRQIAEETGKNPESIERAIRREQITGSRTLSELAGTDKHRPEIKKVEQAILKTAREIKTGRRKERQDQREEQRQELLKTEPPLKNETYQLFSSKFQDVELESNSIDAIITDPPYALEFISEYKNLSEYANRILKPNAPCLVMCGQSWLKQALINLSSSLAYVWTIAFLTPGASVQVFGRKIKSNWKPIIFLVNGKNECEHIKDIVEGGGRDKQFHDWGQNEEGMSQLVERFTVKGDIVLDPFCGAGTTGVAAINMGRRFIGIDNDKYSIKQTGERLKKIVAERNL